MQTLLKAPTAHPRWDGVVIRCAVIVVFVLLVGGCAAFSPGGMKAEGARFRQAALQGRQSDKSMMVYTINSQEFPQGDSFAAIRDTNPSSEGAKLLRDQVLIDVTIAKTVNQCGLPAAVGFASSSAGQVQHFSMFYKTPPRTLMFKRSSMDVQWLSLSQLYESYVVADLPTVPRSVQRLAFNEGPLAPPWPITIPQDLRDAFTVPPQPAAPPTKVDGHDYIAVADSLAAACLPHSANIQNWQRAEAALFRLEPFARIEGLSWRVEVINAKGPMGFGVPDGTLFVSDGLVQELNDVELAAVIAHLMGHEQYQHARSCARRHNIMVAASFVGAAFQFAAGGVGFFLIPTGSYPALISDPQVGYTEEYEVEANYAAARLLCDANLPPDSLFDAMVKLSGKVQPGTLAFASLHHLSSAMLLQNYGLMLDAGICER